MASNRPSLSTRRGGNLEVGSDIQDGISLLDVLYANEFEGEPDDAVADKEVEVNFYRGSQAQWRNFYLAEQPGPDGRAPVWIKRDGYDDLRKRIQKCDRMTSTLKLLHQPGSGGTTLAMQLLWDLRAKLRCAILTSPTADKDTIAKQVIDLFTAGRRGIQNTVLLLMDDEKILEELQDSIMTEMAERKIPIDMPVVIILNCVRKTNVTEREHFVLTTSLSDAEIHRFEKKQVEISQRYSREHTTFHGFNIMRTNFSPDYVRQACANDLQLVRKNKRPRNHQLLAFIAQMNAYVPGSFFLQSQCQEFLGPPDPIHGGPSFEQRMEPFTHLIVTSSSRQGKHVAMAHPMIAQQWVECFEDAGVTRSDTARNLLQYFCGHETPSLMSFIKDMLTKREQQARGQDQFSRLIHDIMEGEGFGGCRSVLEVASNKFEQNPYFPQALARLLYINRYYPEAERWAIKAKTRDPNNSFIADTLGQVHKNHLISMNTRTPREMLQVAQKAIDAFKDVERAAEREQGADMRGDGTTKVSHIFNNRGLFGYLQVANVLFDKLTPLNLEWKKVLTMESPIDRFISSIGGDHKLLRYKLLFLSLRDKVEKKFEFLFQYITYSKPGILKDEPHYFLRDVQDCYNKYVGKCKPRHSQQAMDIPFQRLKEEMAFTFPGVLSSIESLSLRRITNLWKEVAEKDPNVNFTLNFILANVMLSNVKALPPLLIPMVTLKDKLRMYMEGGNGNHTPDFYLLALLLFWPESEPEEELDFDINQYVKLMQLSYGKTYKMYFRSRYLRPLFFLGKGGGYDRLVHSTVIDNLVKINHWTDSELRESPEVQEKLLKMNGEVRNYRVITRIGGEDIQLHAHLPGSIWKPGRVSFYLGFNIRRPEAFGIHYSPEHQTTETKIPTDSDHTSSTSLAVIPLRTSSRKP